VLVQGTHHLPTLALVGLPVRLPGAAPRNRSGSRPRARQWFSGPRALAPEARPFPGADRPLRRPAGSPCCQWWPATGRCLRAPPGGPGAAPPGSAGPPFPVRRGQEALGQLQSGGRLVRRGPGASRPPDRCAPV